ncbi:diaminopimelate decarboxylase family protein [Bifidobacterium bombi]|uniref:Diaminopimelate decarboxylase n=1 Tax=Bifidobacterium bombi DSM 19703 TaxID=1341695 RepID=A0A086BNL2_9BIFI|nr:diaminopimelate decarboxylase [Bifidobacterium bombi]KFF30526.1 diaminopimelate decarboxylase [Bifidobacterium bombi DSM 19703]
MAISAIWPKATDRNEHGELTFHGNSAASLLERFGSPLYVMDTDELRARAGGFVQAAAKAFPTATTHVSYAGKAFLSKEVCRIVSQEGMLIDTCSMGEMRIALAAGIPGRRLVLHGNNKSDAELELAIAEGFNKIVVDSPDDPERVASIARRLGKRARVMVRVTCGIHAGGHEYISTAHEDQKFGLALLPAGADPKIFDVLDGLGKGCGNSAQTVPTTVGDTDAAADTGADADADGRNDAIRYPYDVGDVKPTDTELALARAMDAVANGPAVAVLKDIAARSNDLELVGIHSHIGSQIHDANAFIQAGQRMMLLRRTFYATDAYVLPEVDLGGGYSVAYTDDEEAMDIPRELARLSEAVATVNKALGMPAPIISFEPGRSIVGPAGVTLYRVGTIKHVALPADTKDDQGHRISQRTYVSVDGGMSDNIRPMLYGANYTVAVAGFAGGADADGAGCMKQTGEDDGSMIARVVGMHCESGDVLVRECRLPHDLKRGDILAIPVTGAYGRTMASNYNQALIPAVVAVSEQDAHLMMRRQTVDDLLGLDVSA